MKRLNFLLIFTTILVLFSCSKDSLDESANAKDETIKIEPGLAHNLILDEFFDNFDENSTNKQNRIDMAIATIDNYLLNQGSDVKFSDIYYNDLDYKNYMDEIINAGTDISQIKNVFREMHRNNETKQIILDKSLELMDIMLEYEGTKQFESVISNFEQEVEITKELSSEERDYLLMSIDVARESNLYWHGNDHNYTPNGFGDVAGADAAGAVLTYQSGAVFYASISPLGPWGGFAVLVGGAALSSILAA